MDEVVKNEKEVTVGVVASWKHCRGFIDAVGRSLPLVNDDAKQLIFNHKAVHAICIVLGMILSMAMFSAQIWSVNWDDNSFRDPENFFARYYVDGLFGQFHHSERVIFISILSVVTVLVSITLMCLLTRTTYTRLLLFSFLAFGIGVVFILFSAYTIQFIILMGRGLPGYFEVELVYLSIFICVPFLGSLFMALSYSSIIQMCGDQNAIKSTSTKTWLTCIGTLLAILVIFLAAVTMCSTNWMTMMAVQQNWNSTENPRLDADCVDEQNNYYSKYWNSFHHWSVLSFCWKWIPHQPPCIYLQIHSIPHCFPYQYHLNSTWMCHENNWNDKTKKHGREA